MKTKLLPKGIFKIKTPDGEVSGKYSMYAIDAFCNANGIDSYMNLVDKIANGMSLGQYADLVRYALNDYDRDKEKYTKADVMDMIDEVFDSVNDAEFVALINHFVGRIADLGVKAEIETNAEGEAEKKS